MKMRSLRFQRYPPSRALSTLGHKTPSKHAAAHFQYPRPSIPEIEQLLMNQAFIKQLSALWINFEPLHRILMSNLYVFLLRSFQSQPTLRISS
jgi:hypothetical protein